jgi:hypothetical protein
MQAKWLRPPGLACKVDDAPSSLRPRAQLLSPSIAVGDQSISHQPSGHGRTWIDQPSANTGHSIPPHARQSSSISPSVTQSPPPFSSTTTGYSFFLLHSTIPFFLQAQRSDLTKLLPTHERSRTLVTRSCLSSYCNARVDPSPEPLFCSHGPSIIRLDWALAID